MRVASRVAALSLGLGALLLTPPVADAQQRARPSQRTVVVELFTAQGCASCPQANQMLGELAERRGVIALTFPVDYWDYLGWRDTFAKPEFTARQRAYVARLRLKEIYTPEAVVAGKREAPAVELDRIEKIIEEEAAQRGRTPSIAFSRRGQRVTVGSGAVPAGGAEVWLIHYDPVRRDVRVRTGENAGKVVTHINVVRDLALLGRWYGTPRSFAMPPAAEGLKSVVLLQTRKGGPILSARAS